MLAAICLPASAAEKLLMERVPAQLEKPVVLTVVRQALLYREWTIVAQDADSVSAKIARGVVDANIRIRHAGDRLVYEDSALGKSKFDHTGRAVRTAVETPSRWIDYLRSDIAEGLQKPPSADASLAPKVAPSATAPSAMKEQPAAQRTSGVQRMQELKEMLDRGLITADEYSRKKEQILSEL
jgi:Short C-terminal domain